MYTIVYFLDYGEAYGGAVHTLLQQARLVRQAGNSVHIFISDYYGIEFDDEYLKILTDNGFKVMTASYQLSTQPEDIDVVCLHDYYGDVLQVVQECNPDLLHSVQLNPMVELISRELRIPHIMNIYPLSPDFFKINYLDIFPHYHICDSLYWAKEWHYYLDTDYTCIRTIVSEVPKQHDKNFNKEIICLCVGAVYSGKNQLEVIKGFHKALQEGFNGRLLLCGLDDGAYADSCRGYILDNQLDNNVQMLGFQYDMDSIYDMGDILICGSRRESYPNVVSEAMAHGLLVLSTPVGGVPEVICDGENGYLTAGMDDASILKGLLQIKDDIKNGNAKLVREKAYETIKSIHAPDAVQDEIIGYYTYVLEDYNVWKKKNKSTIREVIKQFHPIIECFKMNAAEFTNVKDVSLKLWYIDYIRNAVDNAVHIGKEFYVWGTGKMSRSVLDILKVFFDQVRVKGMIDSNKTGSFMQYEIYAPEKILNRRDIVIFVALCEGQWDVVSVLKQYNKEYCKDYYILSPRTW